MVSDKGIINYDDVKHEDIEDIESIIKRDENGKFIGFLESKYKILVKDQYLSIPEELKDAQEECLAELSEIELKLLNNGYETRTEFKKELSAAIIPYNSDCEEFLMQQAENQAKACTEDLLDAKARYLPKEQDELHDELDALTKRYNITNLVKNDYGNSLPTYLKDDEEIKKFFEHSSVIESSLVMKFVERLGREADKNIGRC